MLIDLLKNSSKSNAICNIKIENLSEVLIASLFQKIIDVNLFQAFKGVSVPGN